MTTNFKGDFSATAIGSLPHTNAKVACEIMFKSLPEGGQQGHPSLFNRHIQKEKVN